MTDPSGAMLLSEDASECRVVRVAGGVFTELVDIVPPNATFNVTGAHTIADVGSDFDDGCHINDVADTDGVTGSDGQHDINTDDDGPSTDDIVVQLMPFLDTPNPGGVYKAWVIKIDRYIANGGNLFDPPAVTCFGRNGRPVRNPGACNKPGQQLLGFDRDPGFGPARDEVKTDNFKVKELVSPSTVTVRKFWDKNGDGDRDGDEPLITEDGSGVCGDYTNMDNLATIATEVVPLDETCTGTTGWIYDWEDPVPTSNIFFTGGGSGDVRVTGAVGNYTACESLPKNWAQTAAYLDGGSNLVTNTTDDFTCVTVTINSITGENHTILFGNVQRRYSKLVITCDETGDDTLVKSVSHLTLPDDLGTRDTLIIANGQIVAEDFGVSAGITALQLQEYLCPLASIHGQTGLLADTYTQVDEIPSLTP